MKVLQKKFFHCCNSCFKSVNTLATGRDWSDFASGSTRASIVAFFVAMIEYNSIIN